MADRPPPHAQQPSSFISTPLTSPTDSISFSDSGHVHHHSYIEALEVYTGQGLPSEQPRWEQHQLYGQRRSGSMPQAQLLRHIDQHTLYNHAHTAQGMSNPNGRAYEPSLNGIHGQGHMHHWLPVDATHQHQGSMSVTHIPASFEDPASTSWHQQLPSRHYEYYSNSRHNSIASISATTAASNNTASGDGASEGTMISSYDSGPVHDSQSFQQFDQSPAIVDEGGDSSAASLLSSGKQREYLAMHHEDLLVNRGEHTDNLADASHAPVSSITTAAATAPPDPTATTQDPQGCSLNSQVPAKRKRGRPKINRDAQPPATATKQDKSKDGDKTKSKPTRRQPHNEIERKYREGLNTEMEKLREAIPQARQLYHSGHHHNGSPAAMKKTGGGASGTSDTMASSSASHQKPTKAAVIKTAVEEIERLKAAQRSLQADLECVQRERDEYRREAEVLRRQQQRQAQ